MEEEEGVYMDTRYLMAKLSKDQCLAFLALAKNAPLKKSELVEQLLARITQQDQEMQRLLAMFLYELAVEPVELAELLQCSRSERRRWINAGRIPVLEYRSFRLVGRDLLFPVFERRVILAISPTDIASWREEHLTVVRERKQSGARVAAESRKNNRQARQQSQQSWAETVYTWQQIAPPELVVLLQLCYWTVWASRWAKENQLKALRSTKLGALYHARKDAWYARKNEAMRLLAHAPQARLSFYRPPDPDKRHLWLCDEHYELKCELYYESVWDFFSLHSAEVMSCPCCSFSEETDYYSLYYLEVSSTFFPELRFSFHMPYPVGKTFFPLPTTLPSVEHVEQDGLFRFGRSLVEEEKVLYRENDVLASFEEALQCTQNCYTLPV
jgi:hypothetical protein